MFRKKDAETDAVTEWVSPARQRRQQDERASRPGAAQGRPAWPDRRASRRRAARPGLAGAPAPHDDADRYGKRLIVGRGIRLSGEISSCERLVVQGEVEVTLNDTLALEIAEAGRFTGGCEVEEADISGVYEGDLTVRKHLCVRGTGRLSGTIRYAQLELERGGQIAGNISVIARTAAARTSAPRASTGARRCSPRATPRRPRRRPACARPRGASGARSSPGRRPPAGSNWTSWRRADATRNSGVDRTCRAAGAMPWRRPKVARRVRQERNLKRSLI